MPRRLLYGDILGEQRLRRFSAEKNQLFGGVGAFVCDNGNMEWGEKVGDHLRNVVSRDSWLDNPEVGCYLG